MRKYYIETNNRNYRWVRVYEPVDEPSKLENWIYATILILGSLFVMFCNV